MTPPTAPAPARAPARTRPRAAAGARPLEQPGARPSRPARPPLRVVRPGELTPKARRRRARLLALGAVLLFVVTLFGVAASHVVLAQNQFRLERLEAQASTEQARFERLRKQVAELESPERVVAVAQERLGMVPPGEVTYLPSAPAGAGGNEAAGGGGPGAPAGGDDASSPSTAWSTVKPHLEPSP